MPCNYTTYCFICKHTSCTYQNHDDFRISTKKVRFPKKNANRSKMKKFFKFIGGPDMKIDNHIMSDNPVTLNLKDYL